MSGECDCAGCQRIAELDADRGGLAAHLVTLSQDLERVTDERDDLQRQLDEAVSVAGRREERLRELEARLPLVDLQRDAALRDAELLTVQRERLTDALKRIDEMKSPNVDGLTDSVVRIRLAAAMTWVTRIVSEALAEVKARPTNDLLANTNSSRSAGPPVPRDANGSEATDV